jgi:anti-sigma B factor antagonist
MSINIKSQLNESNSLWDVCLSGEIDVSTANEVKENLINLISKQSADIKLDMTNLDYIDSTGLGALIGVLKRLKENDRDIYITNTKKNVRKIFNITGLDKIFKVEG